MKIFITYILLNLNFLVLFAQKEYPEWFLFPKLYQHLSIGFSYKGNSALKDAACMYCVYNECYVEGNIEFLESNTDYVKNTQYYYYYDSIDAEKIETSLFLIDGFCNNTFYEDFICAFSLKEDTAFSCPIININSVQIPSWINKLFWKDKKYYYGVGMFTSKGNDNDAWKTSEERAFYNILTSVSLNIYSENLIISEINTDIKMLNYIKIDLKYEVHNIETLERWPDIYNNYFYTLVRINKSDIISYLKD